MALTTYADLKTAIANWTKRSDLDTYLDDIIRIAELRIEREVQTHDQETALSVTTDTPTVPTDFLSLRNAYVDIPGTPSLIQASPDQIYQNRILGSYRTSVPQYIAQSGGQFIFWPTPASNYTIKGSYYARGGTLATAVYTMFTNNPDLYLYASLAATAPFLKDDKRIQIWETEYQNVKKAVMQDDEGYRFGGRLQITAGS